MIFLLNPIAGKGKWPRIRKSIETFVRENQIQFEIYATNPEGNYAPLREKILNENFTDVIVAGGDGTISAVVNGLRDTGVSFGLLPCGSCNGLALAAGIPRNTKKALELIITGKARGTDAFLINKQLSCMLSGLGFDAQVAHDFARQHKRGLFTYVWQTFRNFMKARPYSFEISAKANNFKTEAFFISIANSNQFGNRFTIAPKASLHDGLLDIVIVQKMNKLQMLKSVFQQVRNGDISEEIFKEDGILYFQTDSLTIRNLQQAPFHIDGDPKPTADEFAIEVIPSAFLLIQPA